MGDIVLGYDHLQGYLDKSPLFQPGFGRTLREPHCQREICFGRDDLLSCCQQR